MLVAVTQSVSVLNEFDTGIHDLLVKNLVTSLYKSLEGQLILTTHNTLLMEGNFIPKDSIYIINELNNGNKEVQCILHYYNKIGDNNNVRRQYRLGKYSGIPADTDINFSHLYDMLK